MPTRSVALAVAVLTLALAASAQGWFSKRPPLSSLFPQSEEFQFEPPAPGSYPLPVIKTAPDGTLLDIHGVERTLSEVLDGKISLVSFVYLMCTDEAGCPFAISTLFSIYEASEKVPELRDDVQLVVISFDPERDTVEAIESFAYPVTADKAAGKKLPMRVFTTRDEAALKPIIDGFGQAIDRPDDQEVINHLLRMYLVDRDGKIRNIYGLGLIDPRLLMTDVETLLMTEGTR